MIVKTPNTLLMHMTCLSRFFSSLSQWIEKEMSFKEGVCNEEMRMNGKKKGFKEFVPLESLSKKNKKIKKDTLKK